MDVVEPVAMMSSCRSRKTADKMFAINESLKQVLFNSEEIKEEAKLRCYHRFKEIYETAIKKNILIGGESWEQSQVDVTPEYEPVDTGRQKFFQQELLPMLNDDMVEVTKKRKSCSHTIEKNTAKYREANVNHYSKLRVSCPRNEHSDVKASFTIEESIGVLRKTSESICDANKKLLEAHSSLTRLEAAFRIQESVKDKQNDILNVSLVQIEASKTPLKQKLNNLDKPDISHKNNAVRRKFSGRQSYRIIANSILKEKS